jgi:hypothetical protein
MLNTPKSIFVIYKTNATVCARLRISEQAGGSTSFRGRGALLRAEVKPNRKPNVISEVKPDAKRFIFLKPQRLYTVAV